MIAALKQLPGALQALVKALEAVATLIHADLERRQANGNLEERLGELERSRAIVEGEVSAALQEVESRFKAARSAEERARHMVKRLEDEGDEFAEGDEEGAPGVAEYLRYLQEGHGAGGQEEGVQPVRSNVATPAEEKQQLRRLKLGV